ncbi:helix-turn-helix transcriptional regulator [Rouxiella sp. Mn2063]|uniref:AraC family transcriptional regulator n=1 Tax=Rouxiella sp. Mn2063 TaxID=3395262 RepID=UPI003BCA3076
MPNPIKSTVDIPIINNTLLPSQVPVDHCRLFSLAHPFIQQPHQVRGFRFFEASLLRIKSGRLQAEDEQGSSVTLESRDRIMLIAQNTQVNVSKTPDAENGYFQSLYLSFSSDLIAAFYREHAPMLAALSPLSRFKTLVLDEELQDTLDYCLRGLEGESPSTALQQHRLQGVLIALAERGIVFMPHTGETISTRLTTLLASTPEFAWTAADASQQLAMSEATLRRRLAEEQTSFRELLQDVRMHHAMALLQTTRWSLTQIADACGYRASSRFSLRFKQRFGCSPADIR